MLLRVRVLWEVVCLCLCVGLSVQFCALPRVLCLIACVCVCVCSRVRAFVFVCFGLCASGCVRLHVALSFVLPACVLQRLPSCVRGIFSVLVLCLHTSYIPHDPKVACLRTCSLRIARRASTCLVVSTCFAVLHVLPACARPASVNLHTYTGHHAGLPDY
jgi:hypothetical protein